MQKVEPHVDELDVDSPGLTLEDIVAHVLRRHGAHGSQPGVVAAGASGAVGQGRIGATPVETPATHADRAPFRVEVRQIGLMQRGRICRSA
jgi:hypothetical protein